MSTHTHTHTHTHDFEKPWLMPTLDECEFYTTMNYPDGETVKSVDYGWTIPSFRNYIGKYDIKGKTILDVGTASGFIAFEAEKAGAAEVTALDMASTSEYRGRLVAQNIEHIYTDQFVHDHSEHLIRLKNSWWYSWHKNKSKARCIYMPHSELHNWSERFDIVIAGAIVEHLSDPVFSIGAWAKAAKEAVIIPFTGVAFDDRAFMRPVCDWTDSNACSSWWELSSGLYHRIFDNLGFDVTYKRSYAIHARSKKNRRPTIIARRR